MILTMVTFPTPSDPPADPEALIRSTAPAYRSVPGLRRKYFMGNSDVSGGLYEWQDRASAEAFYNEDWWSMFRERYSVVPELRFFDAPCLVDNVAEDIVFDLPVARGEEV